MTFKGHSRSPEMSRFDRGDMISYYRSIVTLAVSCIVSHIEPDNGRKSRNLYAPSAFSAPIGVTPFGISQRGTVVGKLNKV